MPARTLVLVIALTVAATAGCDAARGDAPDRDAVYLRGTGTVADDWSHAPLLSERRGSHSDLVALWQAVLWADGYLERTQVRCRFDAATDLATRAWQSNHALNSDGIVGAASFGAAARALTVRDGVLVYPGDEFDVPLRRDRTGRYLASDEGTYRPLREDAATLHTCA